MEIIYGIVLLAPALVSAFVMPGGLEIYGMMVLIALPVGGIIAGGVTAIRSQRAPSLKEVAGLSLLVFGVLTLYWCMFIVVGGPEGKNIFYEPAPPIGATLYLILCATSAFAAFLLALRLLLMPAKWAAIFLIPAVLSPVGAAIRSMSLVEDAGFIGSILCLIVIVVLWARRIDRADE
jgi:hypothetical protein